MTFDSFPPPLRFTIDFLPHIFSILSTTQNLFLTFSYTFLLPFPLFPALATFLYLPFPFSSLPLCLIFFPLYSDPLIPFPPKLGELQTVSIYSLCMYLKFEGSPDSLALPVAAIGLRTHSLKLPIIIFGEIKDDNLCYNFQM